MPQEAGKFSVPGSADIGWVDGELSAVGQEAVNAGNFSALEYLDTVMSSST